MWVSLASVGEDGVAPQKACGRYKNSAVDRRSFLKLIRNPKS